MGARATTESRLDVWLARPELARAPEARARLLPLLSVPERARIEAFRTEASRREHLVARALCRVALSRRAGVPAEHLRFVHEPSGRPVLEQGQVDLDLRFSLTHTTGLVACVVAIGRDVGVDAEHVHAPIDAVELATRFFSPREASDVRDRAVGERTRRFVRYWTLKEAWLKARGLGVGTALREAEFRLDDDDRGDENCLVADVGESGRWRFWQWSPTPDHVLAVACDRMPLHGPLELRVVESEQIP